MGFGYRVKRLSHSWDRISVNYRFITSADRPPESRWRAGVFWIRMQTRQPPSHYHIKLTSTPQCVFPPLNNLEATHIAPEPSPPPLTSQIYPLHPQHVPPSSPQLEPQPPHPRPKPLLPFFTIMPFLTVGAVGMYHVVSLSFRYCD